MAYVLATGFLLLIAAEAPRLIRERMWKDLAVFLLLIVIGAYYSLGQVLEWSLPNPTDALKAVFVPLGKATGKLLS